MCYEISRRNIIVAALGGVATGLGLQGATKTFTVDVAADLFERRQTVADLLNTTLQDKADKNKSYLRGTDMAHWHSEVHPFFQQLVSKDIIPAEGLIVELGSYQGRSLEVLNHLFGAHRVRGCDVYAYTKNPQVIVGDVRSPETLAQLSKAALVWNDVSNWKNSPRSKLAAFEWAKKNLVSGGIYIDDAMKNLPLDLDLSGFKLIYSKGYITAFKKT